MFSARERDIARNALRRAGRVYDKLDYRKLLDDPLAFAARCLTIRTKAGQLRPLNYNRVQQDFLRRRTGRDLILKARQHGISTLIQAEHFRLAISRTAMTATLSHENESTQKLRRMVDLFYTELPPGLQVQRHYANARLFTYPEHHSETIIATAGNIQTGRGGTYTHVHGTEVAFYADGKAILAGILQGGNPDIVLESTPNGAQGYFYELCSEALDGSPYWRLHFYPWWWSAEYAIPLDEGEVLVYSADELQLVEQHGLTPEQIKWRRTKQYDLKDLFTQEYPEDPKTCFLLSGQGYFGDVSKYLVAPMDPVVHRNHRYVAGMDFGQTIDFTTCCVYDVTTGCEVAQLRINRMAWGEMRRQVVALCKKWGVSRLLPEENSMGGTNIEELRKEMQEAGCRTLILPFSTSDTTKKQIMSALHEAIHTGRFLMQDDPIWTREMNAFVSKLAQGGHWRLEAAGSEHDDTVIARALANHAAQVGEPRHG